MELEIIILSEVSRTEKHEYMILLVGGILKKKIQVNLYTKDTSNLIYKMEIDPWT